MYKVHDTILYGSQICRIEGDTTKNFNGETKEYYVLKPIFNDTSTIYVPVDNEKLTQKMRRILSASEIYELIRSMPETDSEWIENETERKETYQAILNSGDRKSIVRMIKALYGQQQRRQAQGRRLRVTDERFLKEAERVLYDEFALVLNIRQEQVLPFILEQIKVSEKTQP